MKSGSTKYIELLESRLELLRTLIRTEEEWRRAFIAFNLRDSERCTANEELICEGIRHLDREIASLQTKGREISSPMSFEVDLVSGSRIRAAMGQMETLQSDLKRLNETKRALLRRSKITINALRNLFNSLAPIYSAPAAPSIGMNYEEIV